MKATAIADAMDGNGGDCRNEKTATMDGDDGKNSEGGID